MRGDIDLVLEQAEHWRRRGTRRAGATLPRGRASGDILPVRRRRQSLGEWVGREPSKLVRTGPEELEASLGKPAHDEAAQGGAAQGEANEVAIASGQVDLIDLRQNKTVKQALVGPEPPSEAAQGWQTQPVMAAAVAVVVFVGALGITTVWRSWTLTRDIVWVELFIGVATAITALCWRWARSKPMKGARRRAISPEP